MSRARVIEERFEAIVGVICGLYALIQTMYVAGMPLVMDEFQGAGSVLQFKDGLPYRDFTPYKTVLGYYVQLLPISLSSDPWWRLLIVKWAMAAITTVALYAAARMLARHLKPAAVVVALLLLVCMSTFLEQSASLRVDMMTGLAGLFSLLYLLERRPATAGAMAGASFLISQKGIYYILAAGVALGAHWALGARDRRSFRDVALLTLASLAMVAAYLVVFGLIGSFSEVIELIFLAHRSIALENLYDIRDFWLQTLLRNPWFYGVALLGLGYSWARRDPGTDDGRRDAILWTYSVVLLGLCLWHRQPWPYFFVLLIPTCFVLVAVFFDAELRRPRGLSAPLTAATITLGVLWPLWTRVPVVLARDNEPQRLSVALAERLLEPADTYLAGMTMVNTRRHVAPDILGWLDRRRLMALRRADLDALIAELGRSRLKLIIWNYRMEALPDPLAGYLRNHYTRVHGNIYLYSPLVTPDTTSCEVAFAGDYGVWAESGGSITLGDRRLDSGETITLPAGPHPCPGPGAVRLVLRPPGVTLTRDVPPVDLFKASYTY